MLDELIKMTPEPSAFAKKGICPKGMIVFSLPGRQMKMSALVCACLRLNKKVLNLPEGHDSFFSVRSGEKNVCVCLRLSAAKKVSALVCG